jgi:16S rRNA A1518/A1519 N6-dimethyltransferase RsmA/KsgA/DIM1 with predicted DNA glycosylase/AP lyase activity
MPVNLDQHMMTDESVIKKIVVSASAKKGDTILEIGAGTGNLTAELARTGAKVVAVEIDRDMVKLLERRLSGRVNVKVVHGDGLSFIKKARFSKLVSNIPYAICEPLFQAMKKMEFELAVLTVPRGFADRITSDMTMFGAECGIFFDIEVLFDVPAVAFEPEPDTVSSVVRLRPRKSVLRDALLQPHAKVRNALMEAVVSSRKCTKNQAREAIKAMKLTSSVAEKRVGDMDLNDLRQLISKFK